MKAKEYSTGSAFKTALQERLKIRERQTGINIQRLQRRVAFDRLLCRLFLGHNVPWILKGGHALELRIEHCRATKDIDLSLRDAHLLSSSSSDEQNRLLHELLVEKSQINLADFFVFEIGKSVMELDAPSYGGARFPVSAFLDDKLYIRFSLDVGIGDSWIEPHDQLELQDWLIFAGIDGIRVPVINSEQHFAEKVHAYSIPREDRVNSRVKDLIDMILLIQNGKLNHDRLLMALQATFIRRKTHAIPVQLLPPPVEWAIPFQRLAEECDIRMDMTRGFEIVQQFWNGLEMLSKKGINEKT